MPKASNDWLYISKQFEEQCNFSLCIGALHGKHIMLQCHINSVYWLIVYLISLLFIEYYNYKSFHSIVLFALFDADYKFLFADIGFQAQRIT